MYKSLVFLFLVGVGCGLAEEAPNAMELTEENFKDEVSGAPHFVMFFAPWCGHCKRLAPVWDTMAEKFNKDAEQEVKIGLVDCTQQTALCSAQDVTGYPTLKFFKSGAEKEDGVKYRGNRDQVALEKFIRESMGQAEPEAAEEAPAAVVASEDAEVKDGLTVLTEASFKKAVGTGDAFIKFYAPWCGHCIKLVPTWDSLAKEFESDDRVKIAKIDCTAHQSICKELEVRGYPTLAYFRAGAKVEAYKGGRGLEDLKGFVSAQLGAPAAAGDVAAKEQEPEAPSAVAKLDKESFKGVVEKGVTFVKFFAPWCGHCKRMAPTWEKLAENFADNEGVTIGHVDCTVDDNKNKELCNGEGVNGFPTLNIYKDGEKVAEYSGKRDLDALVEFVEKHTKPAAEEKEVKDEL